jgi:alkaline phosphatase D
MADKITRRQALIGVSSTLLLPVAGSHVVSNAQEQPAELFLHGVASGDPDPTSVVIWTRISNFAASTDVGWLVASDDQFRNVVSQGRVKTDASRDHTVKVVAGSLQPGREYYYRFHAGDRQSPIGRTRTLPTGHLDRLVLAVASCSNYPFGFFNAYEVIANDASVDMVIHLGDYIYEYSEDQYGGATGKRIGRQHEPPHEILSLADYRQRLAQYRTDRGSQMMHARHPLIAIWDDHETANNPWTGGAENHQPDEGSWEERRAASLQAWYEWMPVREPAVGGSRERYWRHFRFGDLASLITIESRHTARSLQIDSADYRDAGPSAADARNFENRVINAPDRRMLSAEMEEFLQSELAESVREKRRWRIIGNQTVMAKRRAPTLDEPFFDTLRGQLNQVGVARLDGLKLAGSRDMLMDLDAWNGYPAARERFYQTAKGAGARDLMVLSGDSHSYWANALFDDDGQSMGVELGTTGITSPRSILDLGVEGLRRFDELNAAANTEVVWTDGRHKGFIRLELRHDAAHADYVTVTNVESREYDTRIVYSVDIESADGMLNYV